MNLKLSLIYHLTFSDLVFFAILVSHSPYSQLKPCTVPQNKQKYQQLLNMSGRNNLPSTYTKHFNYVLKFFREKYPNHHSYYLIQNEIRKKKTLRSLTLIFKILNEHPQFCQMMVQHSKTEQFKNLLFVYQGNLEAGLKQWDVFLLIIRDPSVRVPKNTWKKCYQILHAKQNKKMASQDLFNQQIVSTMMVNYSDQPVHNDEQPEKVMDMKKTDQVPTADTFSPYNEESVQLESLELSLPQQSSDDSISFDLDITYGFLDCPPMKYWSKKLFRFG